MVYTVFSVNTQMWKSVIKNLFLNINMCDNVAIKLSLQLKSYSFNVWYIISNLSFSILKMQLKNVIHVNVWRGYQRYSPSHTWYSLPLKVQYLKVYQNKFLDILFITETDHIVHFSTFFRYKNKVKIACYVKTLKGFISSYL